MSSGNVVQIIGAVVDVQFPRGEMPKVYDALTIESVGLTLEVQQQLGDGVVRTIAMGSTDGLQRGVAVTEHRRADQRAGRPGDPGPHHGRARSTPSTRRARSATDERWAIHRDAPKFEDQASSPPRSWRPASRSST